LVEAPPTTTQGISMIPPLTTDSTTKRTQPDPGLGFKEKGDLTVVQDGAEQPAAPVHSMVPAAVLDPDRRDDTVRTLPKSYILIESIGRFDQGSQSKRKVRRPARMFEDPWRYPFGEGK
jgi:hypothetical protein